MCGTDLVISAAKQMRERDCVCISLIMLVTSWHQYMFRFFLAINQAIIIIIIIINVPLSAW